MDFELLQKCYLSLKLKKEKLQNLTNCTALCPDTQENILKYTIHNPLAVKYSAPLTFKRNFLRWILDEVEMKGEELSESLLLAYTDVLQQSNTKDEHIYCSYMFNKEIFTLKEDSVIGAQGTTGLRTWEAAIYLCEWCIKNSSVLKNKKILELGAGMGLLGCVVLSFCQPFHYNFTDKSHHVLELLKENVELNKCKFIHKYNHSADNELYTIQEFTCSDNSSTSELVNFPEVILASDIIFDTKDIPNFIRTINLFLNQGTDVVYIASTIRNEDTDLEFKTTIASSGLNSQLKENCCDSIYFTSDYHFKLYKITRT